ncbi:TPA: hypothetical protein R4M55_001798, partial [Campylobacter jejuni]|nr:hypothetical protein [Campylobacter jejuni]
HHFEGHLGIDEAQKLASRAFKAMEKIHYRRAWKIRFKSKDDDMSLEGKSAKSTLKRKGDKIAFGKGFELAMKVKANDEYAHLSLLDKTKYVRILKREIRGKQRFFVQLIQEGFPPTKRNRKIANNNNRVGLDEGTSTVAIVSKDRVELRELAPEINTDAKELRRIERAMDRSKRATNPNNYNSNGTIKQGCKWAYSGSYKKLRSKRKEMHRKMAVLRKQSHEKLANDILALGSDIRVETMRFQSLQKRAKKTTRNKKNDKINKKKRYGKSIANHAPAMLLTIIDRKLGYQGRSIKKIDTYATKASQYNHATGEFSKKQLSERWNNIEGMPIQRDLYSAFLIGNTTDSLNSIDVNLCNALWAQFVELHNREIARLKQSNNKTLRWFVA